MQDWVGVRPLGFWSASLERSDCLATLSMFVCLIIHILVRWYICQSRRIPASAYLTKCTDGGSHDVPVSHLDLHSAGVKHLTTCIPQTPHSPLLQQFMMKSSGPVLHHGRAGKCTFDLTDNLKSIYCNSIYGNSTFIQLFKAFTSALPSIVGLDPYRKQILWQ